MRISLLIEERALEDALRALQILGFTPDPDEPPVAAAARPHVFAVAGELPDRRLPQLQDVAGVLDWTILPLPPPETVPDADIPAAWPFFGQRPETD